LTIEYCVKHGISDSTEVNRHAFSPGFIASQTRKEKFNLLNCNCGYNGYLDSDVILVKKYGCPFYSYFPSNCSTKIDENVYREAAKNIKLKESQCIYLKDNTIDSTKVNNGIQTFKRFLLKNHPLIISINENKWFQGIKTLKADCCSENKSVGPHDICIIGFDDQPQSPNNGCFLVKNNFLNWGSKGFSWIRYNDMMKIITEALVIEIQ
jgi:hypothetical protein